MSNAYLIAMTSLLNVLSCIATATAKNPFPNAGAPGVCWTVERFELQGGSPPLVIDFDAMPCGEVLDGQTFCGVRFERMNAPLEVVCADETFTPSGFIDAPNAAQCALRATSGQMLLSPGGTVLVPGPNPSMEDDDIIMTFDPPVACIGFDHISQYADGMSYTQIKVISVDGEVLHHGTLDIGSGRWLIEHREQRIGSDLICPPAVNASDTADFWGYVSEQANIRHVCIDETDDNNVCPDSNIGIDSIRFAPAPAGCCGGDITGDGVIDSEDIRQLIFSFGTADPVTPAGIRWSPADFNRDKSIDSEDLLEMLARSR